MESDVMGSSPGKLADIKAKRTKSDDAQKGLIQSSGRTRENEERFDKKITLPLVGELSIEEVSQENQMSSLADLNDVFGSDQSMESDSHSQTDDGDAEKNDPEQAKPKHIKKIKKLTEDQIIFKKEKTSANVAKYLDTINTNDKGNENCLSENYTAAVRRLHSTGFSLKGAPRKVVADFRNGLGISIVDNQAIPVICKNVVDILISGYRSAEGKVQSRFYQPLKYSLLVLINFSDYSVAIAEEICAVVGFMEFVRDKLKELYPQHIDSSLKQNDTMILKCLLNIVHNCAAVDSNIEQLSKLQYTETIVPYLEAKEPMFRLQAIAVLADIVDENMCEILKTNSRIIKFLMKVFEKSLGHAYHRRYLGWTTRETGRTIRRLARNDANKKMLVEHGVLPLLVKQTQTGDVEEQRESVGAIWSLAFDDENQEKMMEPELGVVDILTAEQSSEDATVSRACQGTLWTMRERLKASEKYRELGNGICVNKHEANEETKHSEDRDAGHVMISYQWACQPTLIKVRDELRYSGFRVWMDIDDMGGSTLQAMAEAVENSFAVLICFSQKYKDSPNCRAEAEYAFQKRKLVVPLLMQQGYHPDGWLGLIIGPKLFYDLSGKYSFESRIGSLLKELRKSPVDSVDAKSVVAKEVNIEPLSVMSHGISGHSSRDDAIAVQQWTQDNVSCWLDKHQLPRNIFKKLTGKEIIFLRDLRIEAPEAFYKVLIDVVGVRDLPTLMQFTEALHDVRLH